MYFIDLHNGIQNIIKGYIRIGFWHHGDKATVKEMSVKIFYSIYYAFFPISLLAGAIATDNKNESMFLVEVAIIYTVILVRLCYIMWKQKEISEFLHLVSVYPIKYEDDFNVVDKKLNTFMRWITYFYYYLVFVGLFTTLLLPFITSRNTLFFNIGFPLDYKNNEIAYWIAVLYIFTEVFVAVSAFSFSITIWYLLMNSGLQYKVLGCELERMGFKNRNISVLEKENSFNRDVIAGIESHKGLNKSTQRLETFLFNLLSVQLATSAFCICVSVYCVAFNTSGNIMELYIYFFIIIYNSVDIFMLMYFGNEIQISSGALSYCLFKSNWMDQSQSCKKLIIIFGERLKQRQQILTLKIYPLTLETFTSILNAAYSLFNILKTLATK